MNYLKYHFDKNKIYHKYLNSEFIPRPLNHQFPPFGIDVKEPMTGLLGGSSVHNFLLSRDLTLTAQQLYGNCPSQGDVAVFPNIGHRVSSRVI